MTHGPAACGPGDARQWPGRYPGRPVQPGPWIGVHRRARGVDVTTSRPPSEIPARRGPELHPMHPRSTTQDRIRRAPKPPKRWTFMAAAEYCTTRCNGKPLVHLNAAGAARLMTWAVRRVVKLEALDWDRSQEK